jgi:DNA-binding NarL/FixJ family response regulator
VERPAAEVRVLLVDDDQLVRAGLTMMIDGAEGIRVVAEAADGAGVPAAVEAHFPDVVLMDLRMPEVDGVTATRRLLARPGGPRVIVLTTFDADEDVLAALHAGASGYLLKDTPPADIVRAVHRVAAGEPILSPQVTQRLMRRTATLADDRIRAREVLAPLTARELDVVVAVARGESNAEIAAELFMGVATVKAHISSVLAKLGLSNRTQLALLAHEAELGQQ